MCSVCSLAITYWLVLLRSITLTQETLSVQNWSPSWRRSNIVIYNYKAVSIFIYLNSLCPTYYQRTSVFFLSTWLTPGNHRRCRRPWSQPVQRCKPPTPLQRRIPPLRQRLRNPLGRSSEILSPSRCLGHGLLHMVQKMPTLLLCWKELHCCKARLFVYFLLSIIQPPFI